MTNREQQLEDHIDELDDKLACSRRSWWASAVAWAIVFAITMYNIHTKVPCP
jgi:hypothetical protein